MAYVCVGFWNVYGGIGGGSGDGGGGIGGGSGDGGGGGGEAV